MKKNNKKVPEAKPRGLGKAKFLGKVGWLSLLFFLSTTLGWAREQSAVVLRQIGFQDSEGQNGTRVLFDSNGDNIPDLALVLYNTDEGLLGLLLKEYLSQGVSITYEDGENIQSQGFNWFRMRNLLSIENRDILELFPNGTNIFTAAVAKRAAQQGQRASR